MLHASRLKHIPNTQAPQNTQQAKPLQLYELEIWFAKTEHIEHIKKEDLSLNAIN